MTQKILRGVAGSPVPTVAVFAVLEPDAGQDGSQQEKNRRQNQGRQPMVPAVWRPVAAGYWQRDGLIMERSCFLF